MQKGAAPTSRVEVSSLIPGLWGRQHGEARAGGQELGSVQEQECGSWCLFKESAMEKPAQLSLFMKDAKQTSLE